MEIESLFLQQVSPSTGTKHTYVHRETYCIYQCPMQKVVWAQSKSRFFMALDLVLVKPECPSWAPELLRGHCCWIRTGVCVCVKERETENLWGNAFTVRHAHTKWSQIETSSHSVTWRHLCHTNPHRRTQITHCSLLHPHTAESLSSLPQTHTHTHIHRHTDGHVEHLSSCMAHSRTPSSHELIGKAIKGSTGPVHWRNVLFCYLASKLTKPVRSHLADTG